MSRILADAKRFDHLRDLSRRHRSPPVSRGEVNTARRPFGRIFCFSRVFLVGGQGPDGRPT